MPTVVSANYVRNKTIGLRDGRAQRNEVETTTVGCAVKDWLQLEWPVPYRWVEPGSSALSEKSRSDWLVRQLPYLLWAAGAPKKEGRLFPMNKGRRPQGGNGSRSRSRRKDPLYAEVKLSLGLENHILTSAPDPHSAALVGPWKHWADSRCVRVGWVINHFRANRSTIKVARRVQAACFPPHCTVKTQP